MSLVFFVYGIAVFDGAFQVLCLFVALTMAHTVALERIFSSGGPAAFSAYTLPTAALRPSPSPLITSSSVVPKPSGKPTYTIIPPSCLHHQPWFDAQLSFHIGFLLFLFSHEQQMIRHAKQFRFFTDIEVITEILCVVLVAHFVDPCRQKLTCTIGCNLV